MIGTVLLFTFAAAAPIAENPTLDTVPIASETYAGVALSDMMAPELPAITCDVTPPASSGMPLVSINTGDVLDMNWTGTMELSDPTLRPAPIVVPFLENYPIDNIEVKLRLLNVAF